MSTNECHYSEALYLPEPEVEVTHALASRAAMSKLDIAMILGKGVRYLSGVTDNII